VIDSPQAAVNWLDVAIILVIVWFGVNGYRAGIIREAVTALSVVAGAVFAGHYYDDLARDVLSFVGGSAAARVLSFLVLFGSVVLLGQLMAFLLRGLASLLLLGWADRLLGMALGFFKAFLLVEVLLVLVITYPQFGLDRAVHNSLLGPRNLSKASWGVMCPLWTSSSRRKRASSRIGMPIVEPRAVAVNDRFPHNVA
jgi:membrane protein required for colicin V production